MKFRKRWKEFWKIVLSGRFLSYFEFQKEVFVLYGLMIKIKRKMCCNVLTGGTGFTPTTVSNTIIEYRWFWQPSYKTQKKNED